MGETILALSVLQVVTPVAVAAMPVIWKQIVEALRWVMSRMRRDLSHQDTNLVCINSILSTLDGFPDLSWISESDTQALLNRLKDKTESLRTMLENDNAVTRLLHKDKIAKNIRSIAVMMQLLESSVRARQIKTFLLRNASRDHVANTHRLDLHFYTESQENLVRDLLAILREDNLKPVVIDIGEEYEAAVAKSGTYPRIRYEFQPEGGAASPGYPRTLAVSRGVRECLELILKRLRDLKLMQKTRNDAGGSEFVGVALYETFTEILPKVLMDHLVARRPTLQPHTAQQFCRNLWFFRSFSVSSTFKDVQGLDGLQLEEEDKVFNIDLRQPEWVTWENLQNMSVEVRTSLEMAMMTASRRMVSHECTLCGVYIAGTLLGTEFGQHWEACFRREECLQSSVKRSPEQCCPVCQLDMDNMPEAERGVHANACLDRNQTYCSVFYS